MLYSIKTNKIWTKWRELRVFLFLWLFSRFTHSLSLHWKRAKWKRTHFTFTYPTDHHEHLAAPPFLVRCFVLRSSFIKLNRAFIPFVTFNLIKERQRNDNERPLIPLIPPSRHPFRYVSFHYTYNPSVPLWRVFYWNKWKKGRQMSDRGTNACFLSLISITHEPTVKSRSFPSPLFPFALVKLQMKRSEVREFS